LILACAQHDAMDWLNKLVERVVTLFSEDYEEWESYDSATAESAEEEGEDLLAAEEKKRQ
jgi:hypothetical protein